MFARGVRILLASLQGLLSLEAQSWDTSLTLPGCESLAQEGDFIWVFSFDRRAEVQDTHVGGHLFRFPAQEETPFLREVTPPGVRWRPFGLAYKDGYLWFAHAPIEGKHEVWRFRWNGERLESPKSWRHPAFTSLQAVCAVDSIRFYVANDRKGAARWHLVVGFLRRRVRSSIFLCEYDTCRKVADRIPYASGLAYFPKDQLLLTSVAFRKALWVYQEVGEPTRLQYIRRIKLPGYPDNITSLGDSVAWVVCHKRLNGWARSLAFGGNRSRWMIVEVRFLPEGRFEARPIYRAPKGYATASAAVPVGNYIYIGSVFEPVLLRLKVEGTTPAAFLPTRKVVRPESRHP
ncbi:MAG: hypothetical protein NZ989_00440 [Bacteroidia bacterium]|nr:hypothetical protein [Bacteroidia bacterium]MDW8057730.1 hypothetical protein [Bacteroidia bacterium]